MYQCRLAGIFFSAIERWNSRHHEWKEAIDFSKHDDEVEGCWQGTDQRVERKTKSEEALRLYFVLLLRNLPLHTVAFQESTKFGKQSKPENTTLQRFFHAYAGSYTKCLGDRPTLAKWQDVTTKFLVDACPAHQQNFSQWAHVSGSDFAWTLSETQCKRIAYVTTFQYACAALHYNHFKAWRLIVC